MSEITAFWLFSSKTANLTKLLKKQAASGYFQKIVKKLY